MRELRYGTLFFEGSFTAMFFLTKNRGEKERPSSPRIPFYSAVSAIILIFIMMFMVILMVTAILLMVFDAAAISVMISPTFSFDRDDTA